MVTNSPFGKLYVFEYIHDVASKSIYCSSVLDGKFKLPVILTDKDYEDFKLKFSTKKCSIKHFISKKVI